MATVQETAVTGRPTGALGRITRFLTRGPVQIFLLLVGFLWLLPTFGLLVTSFRDVADNTASGWWNAITEPSQLTVATYKRLLADDGMVRAFFNTILITVPSAVLLVAVAALAAYAFAWMKFPGRDWIFVIVVALLVVPLHLALIPLLQAYANGVDVLGIRIIPDLDLNGTFASVWLAHIGFGLPLAIYLLYNYMSGLPGDIFEAARIDGADHFKIFWRLVLPLSVPALAAFAIFQFLWVWNDFLVAIVFVGSAPDSAPMTVRLTQLVGSRGEDQHILTAGAFLTMIVPLLVFFSLQRYFVRGILAGSVKG